MRRSRDEKEKQVVRLTRLFTASLLECEETVRFLPLLKSGTKLDLTQQDEIRNQINILLKSVL